MCLTCHHKLTQEFFFPCKSGPLSQLGDRLTAYRVLQSPTVLQLREHEGSRAQRQAAGACRGCELQHALEWRSVALVWMQWGGPGPS